MSATPPITHRADGQLQQDPSQNYALTGKIMLASIIILFVVVFVLVALHLYARWYLLRIHRRRRNHRRRSNRIVFYVDSNRSPVSSSAGLDGSVLKSLPVFVYSSECHGNMPECAVCLSEFVEGETGRVLPKCKHCFHTECIDMWFGSHSTCPLCRSPVEADEPETTMVAEQQESVPEPGSPVRRVEEIMDTTSFTDRMKRVDVRIDVPNRNELASRNELTEFQLSSPSQGFWSPGSRLLSFKRIMNMSRKSPVVSPASGVGPSCLPEATESDLESACQEPTQESSRSS
ncbi:hypothetical protein E3N88_08358 [Mikania micrantha]|uniref:RING-type E3 ubiquitin transferase n=1 Tax=Mikania micrantha TaxID=192012 RepID=A0A5N6PGK5_9ASTR|nr:hypothetical protein E3N88_08358 [Mikania micrantha]